MGTSETPDELSAPQEASAPGKDFASGARPRDPRLEDSKDLPEGPST